MKIETNYDKVTPIGYSCLIVQLFIAPIAVMVGWNEFIHPLGLPEINYLWAMGIDKLVTFLVSTDVSLFDPSKKFNDSILFNATIHTVLTIFMMLILGLFV